MTRYPQAAPYVRPHDCYAEKMVFDLEKDTWKCPVCGIPYISPHKPRHQFPPKDRGVFFKPFWTHQPDLQGHINGCEGCDGSLLLEPGKGVHLQDIKASVLVSWRPWESYEVRQ